MAKNSAKKPVKICFVAMKAYPLFNPSVHKLFGGAELDLYTLACELVKDSNYEVSFIVADYGQDDFEIINGVKIYKSLNFKKNSLIGARQIWRAMQRANANIYFQETASPGTLLVGLFCRINNRKFIYRTAHQRETDGTYIRNHPFAGRGFCWALKHASKVIVQNDQDRQQVLSNLGVDSIVIRNAHDLSESVGNDRNTILWVGRSAGFKRPRLFLKLAQLTPDEQFVMICQHATGDNEYDSLQKEAAEIPNMVFIEHVPFRDVNNYFNHAKIYVNTSDSEGFANTFIDACKSGTPILSLSVNPDNFINKYECGLCAKGDWDYFLKLCDRLRKDKEMVIRLGANGKKYMEEKHNITVIVKKYKELFEEIINNL